MGKAFKAPASQYVRRYVISKHAVQRLRERVVEGHEMVHRSDGDLGNLLDAAVYEGSPGESVVDSDGLPTSIIRLRLPFVRDEVLFAVVKPNQEPGDDREVVLSILTKEMEAANRSGGKWTGHATCPGAPMTSLGDKLKNVTPAVAASAPPLPAPPLLGAMLLALDDCTIANQRLLMWQTSKLGWQHVECLSPDDVNARIAKLPPGAPVQIYKLALTWTPVKTRLVLHEEAD
jgi:hypothetical protein